RAAQGHRGRSRLVLVHLGRSNHAEATTASGDNAACLVDGVDRRHAWTGQIQRRPQRLPRQMDPLRLHHSPSPSRHRYGTGIPQAPRFQVARMSARSCLWNSRSATMALGRPLANETQVTPRSSVWYTPMSAATYTRWKLLGATTTALIGMLGRPA